jgi:hypothetical protein
VWTKWSGMIHRCDLITAHFRMLILPVKSVTNEFVTIKFHFSIRLQISYPVCCVHGIRAAISIYQSQLVNCTLVYPSHIETKINNSTLMLDDDDDDVDGYLRLHRHNV